MSLASLTGVAIGAGSGYVAAPNTINRPINGVLFGLAGGLAGALLGSITDLENASSTHVNPLKDRELRSSGTTSQIELKPSASLDSLPPFVMERFSPVVIESFSEKDLVTEDGSIHEPHRAWRIARPGELGPNAK